MTPKEKELIKALCRNIAKWVYCRSRSRVSTMDLCFDMCPDLTADEINEIVVDEIETIKEKQSGIYHQ